MRTTDGYGNTVNEQGECLHDGERVHHDNGGETCTGCGTRFGWPVREADMLATVQAQHGGKVEHTGGGCMALVIPGLGDTVVVVTWEGEYVVGLYTRPAWYSEVDDNEATAIRCNVRPDDLAETILTYLTPCAVCKAPSTQAVCNVNEMPEGVNVWVSVCSDEHAATLNPVVHGIDPADGLSLCATSTPDPTLTACDEHITCDACRDAL